MALVDACYLSAREHRAVEIDEIANPTYLFLMKPYTLIKGTGWLTVVTLLLSWSSPEPVVPVALFADEKPDETRFSKVVLAENLNEPMELAVLPDGRVLVVERNGGILMYDPTTSAMRKILDLPVSARLRMVCWALPWTRLLPKITGCTCFYPPVGDTPQQYVFALYFSDGTIDLSSEKVLIKIPTQREECCHSGGSIAFGKDGTFSSRPATIPVRLAPTTTRRSTSGRAGRPGTPSGRRAIPMTCAERFCASIPSQMGPYTIPEGNLFEKGTPKTRPEIYVMGCRNPIRISADQKNGYLYWGDVGQNGEKDSERGPRSWDEWNQAKRAGNFGWPYFAGDNRPYAEYDFAQEKAGKFFDPENPVNNSIHNTGLKQLPPAQPAFIWYNYVESDLFPHLGTGGKSPMAGPVLYADQYKKSERSFPDYYNGKLFIFEWMRDWINVVTLKPDGSYGSIEPFMPNTLLSTPSTWNLARTGLCTCWNTVPTGLPRMPTPNSPASTIPRQPPTRGQAVGQHHRGGRTPDGTPVGQGQPGPRRRRRPDLPVDRHPGRPVRHAESRR